MLDGQMPLHLRKLTTEDADNLGQWLSDPEKLLLWGGPFFEFPLRRDAIGSLVAMHSGDQPNRECWAAVTGEGAMVGTFQIAYNDMSGQADLGRIVIDPTLRGQGLARHLLRLAIDRAFSRASVHRIELRVFTNNTVAISAYKRIGFTHEGIRRESARLGENYLDTAIMGLLRHELNFA